MHHFLLHLPSSGGSVLDPRCSRGQHRNEVLNSDPEWSRAGRGVAGKRSSDFKLTLIKWITRKNSISYNISARRAVCRHRCMHRRRQFWQMKKYTYLISTIYIHQCRKYHAIPIHTTSTTFDINNSQRPWVQFWGAKNVPSSCTQLGPAQVMEVIIIDV